MFKVLIPCTLEYQEEMVQAKRPGTVIAHNLYLGCVCSNGYSKRWNPLVQKTFFFYYVVFD